MRRREERERERGFVCLFQLFLGALFVGVFNFNRGTNVTLTVELSGERVRKGEREKGIYSWEGKWEVGTATGGQPVAGVRREGRKGRVGRNKRKSKSKEGDLVCGAWEGQLTCDYTFSFLRTFLFGQFLFELGKRRNPIIRDLCFCFCF